MRGEDVDVSAEHRVLFECGCIQSRQRLDLVPEDGLGIIERSHHAIVHKQQERSHPQKIIVVVSDRSTFPFPDFKTFDHLLE